MLTFNKKKNILEPEEYHYELQDVKEPNLFRETFQYTEIPKIGFNNMVGSGFQQIGHDSFR